MARVFEPKPLLVAAGIGAALLLVANRGKYPVGAVILGGAIFGAAVQVGVRALGVS